MSRSRLGSCRKPKGTQSEVIGAILLGDSPCCGVPHQRVAVVCRVAAALVRVQRAHDGQEGQADQQTDQEAHAAEQQPREMRLVLPVLAGGRHGVGHPLEGCLPFRDPADTVSPHSAVLSQTHDRKGPAEPHAVAQCSARARSHACSTGCWPTSAALAPQMRHSSDPTS